MPPEQNPSHPRAKDELAPALEMLAAVSQMEKAWLETENEHTTRQLLTEGLPLLDHATQLFHKANETTLAAWTLLQKASLIGDLARSMGPSDRTSLSRQALELMREAFNRLAESPAPSFSVNTGLYLLMVETLLKIRDLFEDPGQIATLDPLIQSLSAHFGEFLAMDLTLRGRAADQLFTAQVLDSLLDLEEDPQTRQEMLTTSQDLALQAYDQLRASSAADLGPVTSLLESLKNKQRKEFAPLVKLCPQCGAESTPGTRFCSQCGARFSKETQ